MSMDPVDDQAAGTEQPANPATISGLLHRVYKPTHAKAPIGGAVRSKLHSSCHTSPSLAPPAPAAAQSSVFSPTQMMGDAREAPVIHGLRHGGWLSGTTGSPAGTMPSGSSSSLTDDDEGEDATSSPPAGRRPVSSSSSSLTSSESSDKMLTDGAAAGGPLYELSTMLDHLPALKTGLSKYYRGRSQSFTSWAEVSCVEDLAKKTTPYIRRTKASRCYAAALGAKNQLSKKIAKNAQRSSPDRLVSRARSTIL